MYHQTGSVPKPWTGSSVAAERRWAPIRAPTPKDPNRAPPLAASMSNYSKPVAAKKPSLVVSHCSSSHDDSSSTNTKDLNQALDNLETFLQDFGTETQDKNMSDAELKTKVDDDLDGKNMKKGDDDDNNNDAAADKVLDDLTKKLMQALDSNEVVPWKSSEDEADGGKKNTPFGKIFLMLAPGHCFEICQEIHMFCSEL